MVTVIIEEDVPRFIDEDTVGKKNLRSVSGDSITVISRDTCARDRDDVAARSYNFPDAVIAIVGEENIAGSVTAYPIRGTDLRLKRGDIVTVIAGGTGAGDGRDDSGCRVNSANSIVIGVREKEIAVRIDVQAPRSADTGLGSEAAVPDGTVVSAAAAAARKDRDDASGNGNFADEIVAQIRDVDIAEVIDGESDRAGQHSLRGGATIAEGIHSGSTDGSPASDGLDNSRGKSDFANSLIFEVGDVNVFIGIDGHAVRQRQLRVGG